MNEDEGEICCAFSWVVMESLGLGILLRSSRGGVFCFNVGI